MSAPSDDINRIIIGLGGQGSRVVNEVRKAVIQQGGLPAGLEFIAVDSDRIALSNLDSVPEDQRIHLAAPDDNITETVVPWLPHEFRPKAGGGCGMQRLTGKAMYLVHRHRILETVRDVARKLRSRTQISNFMVVVVNAFGGGTGSGMAIDFTIDVRKDLKEITGQDPMMFGIGILPSRSETIQRANGVAMIKELHYLLSHKEPIVINGRDHSNPFELFFLVGRESMGIERDEDLLKGIVRFTIDLGLIPSTSRDTAAAGKGAGWVDLQDIRTLVKGAGHMFSTFGYYRAVFPADELMKYFEALDRIQDIRRQLPSFTTDADAARKALEDKRIALGHAEDVLKTAKARAARLRSDGILGANRPELVKLLTEMGRLEDTIEKTRKEVEAAEADLPTVGERRLALETELKECGVRVETLKASLLAPRQTRTTYTVSLSEEELQRLTENRHIVLEGNFRSIMEALGRLPEYHDRTMEVVGKNKILFMPLLNYRMSFQNGSAFPPTLLSALKKHNFVRYDAAGNPIVSDDHLWMVMAMVSSRPENIDANKLSARAFKEVVEGHVARRAEVKIVPSASKRYEVVIHSWLVGLQVAPIAPGYPPRLRELEWLMPEYSQVAREGGLAQHHAFLYGDATAFSQMTSVTVDRTSPAKTNDLVTGFWAGYSPIDAQARWSQLPPLVAEAMDASERLAQSTAALADAADEFRTVGADMASIDRLAAALTQGTEGIESFGRVLAEDAEPLRERLATLVTQLEQTRVAPRDPERLLALEELVAEALGAASRAEVLLSQLRSELNDTIDSTIDAARPQSGRQRVVDRMAARLEHALARAEAGSARLTDSANDTLNHVRDLERTLERAQEMLRARAVAAPPRRFRKLPEPPVGVSYDAGSNGNGHSRRALAAIEGADRSGSRHVPDPQEENE